MDIPNAPLVPGHSTVRELGRGATASVWLATSLSQGQPVAVKCFTAGSEADPGSDGQSMAGLQREVRILSRLQHEHLVRIHDVVRLGGAFEGRPGLLMDYAAGGSLGGLITARGRLSVGETITVITPLARVLAFLHQEGVVHSDISPGNVLFTAQGKPLLADLGVARMLGEAGRGALEGTPGFTDPALKGEDGTLRPERDCFSLAALAWYCLTGTAPERASRRPPLTLVVPEVPPALAAAIEAGLQEEPGARPQAMVFGSAIYRSAAAAPVDLSDAVDSSVVPELLTRRRPSSGKGGHARRHVEKRAELSLARGAGERGVLRWRGNMGRRLGSGLRRQLLPGPSHRSASKRPISKGPMQHRRARTLTVALGVLFAGLLVAAGAWWSAAPPVASPGSVNPATPVPTQASPAGPGRGAVTEAVRAQLRSEQPEEAIMGLSALRDSALRSGDFRLLAEVNVKGSPAAAADAKVKAEMEGAGVVLAGFTTVLKEVRTEGPGRDKQAAVTAVVETSRFEERDAAGKLVRSRPAGEPQHLRLLLEKVDGGWRISNILAGNT